MRLDTDPVDRPVVGDPSKPRKKPAPVLARAVVVAALRNDTAVVSATQKRRNTARGTSRPFNACAPQLRLPTGTQLPCHNGQVDFAQTFSSQVRSNTLWLTSLAWLGPALDAAGAGDTAALGFAVGIARQFLSFVATPDGRRAISRNHGLGAVNHSFATRTTTLLRLLGLLRSSATPANRATVAQIAREIWISAEWLCIPQHRSPDNHGAMVDLALLDVGAVVPLPNAYVALATSRLADGAERLFDSAGYCRENSTAYHRLNLHFHQRAIARIEQLLGADDPHAARLRAVCNHARSIVPHFIRHDGTMPPIGDATYSDAVGDASTVPVFRSAHLATARHDGSYLSLVCGHSLPFHKHVDDTAITWRSDGTDILIDGGSFNYDRENPIRRCLESTLGHSGLGVEPMEELLARQWCQLAEDGAITRWDWDGARLEARASVAVPAWDLALAREVAWTGMRLEVCDRVKLGDGAPTAARRLRQRWLLGPSLAFVGRRADQHSVILDFSGTGKRVELIIVGPGDGIRVERGHVSTNGMRRTGWFSPQSNRVEPTWVVTVCRDAPVGTTSLAATISVTPVPNDSGQPSVKTMPCLHKAALARNGNSFIVAISDPDSPAETTYAVYLLRNGSRVAVRGYAAGRRAVFEDTSGPGVYAAKVFRRNGADVTSVHSPLLRIDGDPGAADRRADEERLHGYPPARDIPSLDALAEQVDPEAMQRFDVRHGPFTYSLVKSRRVGQRLFVVLVGAIDRVRMTLPRFSRFSWRDEFPGTFVCVADPTLQLDTALRLGWYFGTPTHDATDGVRRIVEAIRERLGVAPEDVCFYGSSGGGYGALQLAARSGRGVTAIAINPQIDVLNYPSVRFVDAFRSTVLGGLDNAAARALHGVRLSAIEAWRTPPAARARLLLVQNRADLDHYSGHYRSFADAFGIPDDGEAADRRMATLVYDHPSGHAAEPRNMLRQILATADRLQW
jgi:Heparinase II/III-like protein